MNHIVWLVFDSVRYDSFAAAVTPNLDRIGPARQSYSYASWTAPSHYNFLMGLLPHQNATNVFASIQYREDLIRWVSRIGLEPANKFSFEKFLPTLSLPATLKCLGYRCEAYVSLPVLNPKTLLSQHFDSYELMPQHNDLQSIISRLKFDETLRFYFINTAETHYPYLLPRETGSDLPRLPGLHGCYRDLDEFLRNPGMFHADSPGTAFTPQRLRGLWEKQVACLEHLDKIVGELLEKVPENTWFIVTSDHGELFGEDGFFGHGPVMHPKVYEVFCLEGQRP